MAKSKSAGSAGSDAATPAPAKEMGKMENDYEAQDALRTMQRSEEHQNDPAMMKRVAAHAEKQSDGLASVMEKLRKQGLVSDKQAERTAQKIATRRTAARA